MIKDDINEVDFSARQLCDLIEIGDLEGIEKILLSVKDYYKAKLMKETEIKVLVIHNMLLLYNRLEQKYKEIKSTLPNLKLLIDEIKKSDNLDDLMEKIIVFSTKAAEGIGVSSDHVIKLIIIYMNKNYDQDLKLETIAKMFNYNSAYLGKIFKKEIGERFNDVLNSIRIENAKRLLNDTDLKVYQVSEAVGYNNIDYFYSKFKKYVGVSPKEFKKEG